MGKKNKMNPFAGKHVGGSGTATRLPSTGKKKKQQRPAATSDGGGGQGGGYSGGGGGQGGGGGRPKRPKSFLGLLAAGAAYAALWAWNVWSRAVQLQDDRDVLDRMAARPLRLTEHAACRMDCRFIGEGEVRETLRAGRINARKSQPRLLPCPKYVVDAAVGPTRKNVVFAACPMETRVITAIDRDTDHPCPPC